MNTASLLSSGTTGTQAGATGLCVENSILTTPSELPWDIVTDILSRLPVKSLMRFMCVSTSFHNLISNDTLFKKQHLNHHQSSLKVLVPQYDTTLDVATSSYILSVSSAGDAREENIDLKFPMQIGIDNFDVHIYNSCDGLFCIGIDGGDVIIWNPSTRQAKRFPCGHRKDERCYIVYSLAHDSRSNVYKLLGIFGANIRLRFYSTETKTWRCVEETPPCGHVRFDGEPTIVNRAFHWLCCHYNGNNVTPHVVSLDVCDETFGTFAMPKSFHNNTRVTPMVLFVTKGKLGVMCETKSQMCWEMWVMSEYGVAESMTRLFSFFHDELTRSCCPLYTLENVDIIMIYGIYFGTSFCKDGRLLAEKKIETHPYAFFESLVSPYTCLENNVSSTEIVASKFSATTSRDNRSKRKHSFFKRLCFCKSF